MKRHLLALLFLLFIFIMTCVYLKTESLYTNAQKDKKNVVQPPPEQKIVISELKKIESVKTRETIVKKSLEETNPIVVRTEESKPLPNKVLPIPTKVHNVKKSIGAEEEEILEYLLSVLEERAEVEAKLQALIKRVLEDRRIAIETMNELSAKIEQEHNERLQKRDDTIKNRHLEIEGVK